MSNVLQTLKTDVVDFYNDDIKPFFVDVSKETMVFLSGAAKAIEAGGGPFLVQLFTDVVVAESKTGGTGAQKLASAVTTIQSDLSTKGVTLALSTIHAGIEAAVANLPENAPAVVATTVTAAVAAVDPADVAAAQAEADAAAAQLSAAAQAHADAQTANDAAQVKLAALTPAV